jgi:hypothetical protein
MRIASDIAYGTHNLKRVIRFHSTMMDIKHFTLSRSFIMDKEEEDQERKKPVVGGLISDESLLGSDDDEDEEEEIRRQVQAKGMILFTTTFYTSVDSTRFQLCLQMINEAHICGMPVVIVDSSPCENVHEALQKKNATSGIMITRLARQTWPGRKGAGLRQAAQIASELPGVTPDTLCFQEPEKVNMVKCWRSCSCGAGGAEEEEVLAFQQQQQQHDVMVMYRSHAYFQKTYPIEQYHSEMFGNLLLDQVAKAEMTKLGRRYSESIDVQVQQETENSTTKLPCFDWHFGPFAFRAKHLELWTKYKDGDMYDAQLVPIVHAFRKGLNVYSVYCHYQHAKEMKDEEQGNVDATLKRLQQLHDLDPRVIQAWTEDFYC